MSKGVDKEILTGFFEEAHGYLPDIRSGLEAVKTKPSELGALEEVHRLVHSIKGAASMVGLSALGHLAYLTEEAIEDLGAGKLPPTKKNIAAVTTAIDQIEAYLNGVSKGAVQEAPMVAAVVRAFRRMRGLPQSGDQAEIDALLRTADDDGVSAAGDQPAEDTEVDVELLETFRAEAREHLQSMAASLRELQERPESRELIESIRRGAHTIKGAAAMVGKDSISHLAHQLEDILDGIYEGGVELESDMFEVLFAGTDILQDLTHGQVSEDGISSQLQAFEQRLAEFATVAERGTASSQGAAEQAESSEPDAEDPEISDELLSVFQSESEEHLEAISTRLRELGHKPKEPQPILQELRRIVHTFKGAAGMVGLQQAGQLAHRMEDLLDRMYDATIAWSPDLQSLLEATGDALEDLSQERGVVAETEIQDLYRRYAEVLKETQQAAELGEEKVFDLQPLAPGRKQEPAAPAAALRTTKAAQYVRVPLERLDELVRLVSELVVNRSTFEQHFSSYIHEVDELNLSLDRLRRATHRVETEYAVDALIHQGLPSAYTGLQRPFGPVDGEFDALEFDRYTQFHLLARDLSENATDLHSIGGQLGGLVGDFEGSLTRLGRLTSEAQDKLMRLRMVPLGSMSARLQRTVRVTAAKQNKRVSLTVKGEGVELDKTVLEEMAGPLEHILRNAVDHGIEPAEMRKAVGKPESGHIVVHAYPEGTQVVIRVTDDGAGFEAETLRAAAVERGLVSQARAAAMPEQELYSVIFQPGFSTARQISEVSGRGVGLDVVKSTVNRLKGSIIAHSKAGQGVDFTIRLPMTIAITRVLLVKAGSEKLAIPLSAVRQILRLGPDEIERVGKTPVVRLESEVLPVVSLSEALDLGSQPPTQRRLPVLVLEAGERKIALLVDQLAEAREVVVKNLGALLRRVEGITGATLMGDGSVVLIVNPGDLMGESTGESAQRRAGQRTTPRSSSLDVMIVDDSVSVRRVLSKLIEGVGWRPVTAKDGVEALAILQQSAQPPDLILLDIEMPRMDGYELTSTLRSMHQFESLPIVMLTSRTGEKHRQKAFQVGATDYLVKPYQEDTLLSVVRRVAREARGAAVG